MIAPAACSPFAVVRGPRSPEVCPRAKHSLFDCVLAQTPLPGDRDLRSVPLNDGEPTQGRSTWHGVEAISKVPARPPGQSRWRRWAACWHSVTPWWLLQPAGLLFHDIYPNGGMLHMQFLQHVSQNSHIRDTVGQHNSYLRPLRHSADGSVRIWPSLSATCKSPTTNKTPCWTLHKAQEGQSKTSCTSCCATGTAFLVRDMYTRLECWPTSSLAVSLADTSAVCSLDAPLVLSAPAWCFPLGPLMFRKGKRCESGACFCHARPPAVTPDDSRLGLSPYAFAQAQATKMKY